MMSRPGGYRQYHRQDWGGGGISETSHDTSILTQRVFLMMLTQIDSPVLAHVYYCPPGAVNNTSSK